MRTLTRKLLASATAAGLVLGATGVASADDISNDLDASIDAVAEVMPLTVGGSNGTTQLYVAPTGGDGKNGCNITGSTTLTVSVSSNNTAVATVSPSSVTFTSCGDTKVLTVTPVSQGSATVSVGQTSNNTGGSFNLAPATFTANVAAPVSTNTAPTISVTGVAGGASYNKGSIPAATCQVTDAQDGNSSFAATLSAITGPYASDGIGSQTASCSYTDGGGLMARSSETYSIVDSSAPVIVPTLTGTLGTNGWYTSNVTLTWSVSDPDSPSSLQKTGCVDQNITADQQATSYTCDATSAGGSTQAATVTIKRDATAPEVNPANVTDPAWRNTNLSQTFSASDTGSGLATAADASFTLTASAESADASTPTVATKTVTDLAGNSTTRTVSAKIDLTSPVILGGNVNNTTWRNTSLSESFTASDALSGLAIPGDAGFTLTASLESANASTPTVVSKTVTDVVGNSTTRTVSALIDLTKPTSVQFVNGPAAGGVYFPTTVPASTCTAYDGLSGLASCSVTGHSTSAGTHTLTATATDRAGNVETATRSYRVRTLTLTGFFSPVDMGGVVNTVKAGSTVPLKFNIVDEGVQQTSTSLVSTFTTSKVSCLAGAAEDEIEEIVTTGQTTLRYDETARQFIQNWQTPKAPGTCLAVTVTFVDGQTLKALFKLK